LRKPGESQEIEDVPQDDSPTYCLLADDRFIDEAKVTTDRLLLPPTENESLHDVVLIIKVHAVLFQPELDLSSALTCTF
jgi:hypothetical protein